MAFLSLKNHALLLSMIFIAVSACDDSSTTSTDTTGATSADKKGDAKDAKGKDGKAGASKIKPIKVVRADLADEDFIEGPNNRDPFRSFLRDFAARGSRLPTIQRKIILQRYGLDELRLIAVVTGGVRAQAMFRAPTGLGVTVKRGDYISKSAGKIKDILSDRVIVEIQERAEGAQALADRVIELHPKGKKSGGL